MRGARVSSIRFFSLPPRVWPFSNASVSQPRLDERCFVHVCVYIVVSHGPTTFLGWSRSGVVDSVRRHVEGTMGMLRRSPRSPPPSPLRTVGSTLPFNPWFRKGFELGSTARVGSTCLAEPSGSDRLSHPPTPPCATGADVGWRTWTRPPPGRLESASTHVWRTNHPRTREDKESRPRDGPSRCVPDLRATCRAQDRKERMRAHPSGRGRAQQGTTNLRNTRQQNTYSNEGDESKRMRDCGNAQLIDPIESRCVLHSTPP